MSANTRILASMLLVCSLVVISTGCVDTEQLQQWIIKEKEYRDVYEWVVVSEIQHDFHTNISGGGVADATYSHSEGFEVNPKSTTIKIEIDIDMQKVGDPGEVPPWLEPLEPIIQNLSEYVRDLQRHVDISLNSPNGNVFWYQKYNDSVSKDKEFKSPMTGNWLIDISGTGIGIPQLYHDALEIVISVREYKGREEIKD